MTERRTSEILITPGSGTGEDNLNSDESPSHNKKL